MTDEEIRNLAVQYATAALEFAPLLDPKNSAEFLTLANEIFDFIKNGTVPS